MRSGLWFRNGDEVIGFTTDEELWLVFDDIASSNPSPAAIKIRDAQIASKDALSLWELFCLKPAGLPC